MWAYREQDVLRRRAEGLYAAEATADGIPVQGVSRDGCAAVERIGRMGCAVDVSRVAPTAELDPDAEKVHRAVLRLAPRRQGLVVYYALRGTRPGWGKGMRPHYEPIWKDGPRYDERGLPASPDISRRRVHRGLKSVKVRVSSNA